MPTTEALPRPQWSDQLEIEHARLGARIQHLLPCLEWPLHLPWIDAINRIRLERGAPTSSRRSTRGNRRHSRAMTTPAIHRAPYRHT